MIHALRTTLLKEKRLPKDATPMSRYSMVGLIEDKHQRIKRIGVKA